METARIFEEYKPIIEKSIDGYLSRKSRIQEPFRELIKRGGKRFRPVMCILSFELSGGKDIKKIVQVASSLEILHNFTLIHDDIMDESDLRRGKPCIHKMYGNATAINTGDYMHSVVYEMILSNRKVLSDEKVLDILEEINNSIRIICEGQENEIQWIKNQKFDVSEEEYFEMIYEKAGSLISTSCKVGAIVSGAGKKEIDALEEFGKKIGIAFQVQDDLLNIIGDVEKYGKEIGGDIREGKRTLMVVYALKKLDKPDRERLIEILNKKENTAGEIQEGIDLLKKSGSIEYTNNKMVSLADEAKKVLNVFPDCEAKAKLFCIADFLIQREH